MRMKENVKGMHNFFFIYIVGLCHWLQWARVHLKIFKND